MGSDRRLRISLERWLYVIRTSVDRPEIMLLVLPLLRKTLTTYNVLHWLLEDMTHPNPTEDGELETARQTNPQVQPAPDPKRIKLRSVTS